MKLTCKLTKSTVSVLLSLIFVLSMTVFAGTAAYAVEGTNITYTFSGDNAEAAGYAEGTVTLSSDTAGTYYLYWADENKALDGYYEIDTMTLSAGGSDIFKFDYHTAIPANATKIIATTSKSDVTVANAAATYTVPVSKRLSTGSGDLLYTFNSYSDVHIDANGYYIKANERWAQALKYGVDMGTDFIVSSGDMVTNASGPDPEWLTYEEILSQSDYVNPVWESDGNHDMRSGVSTGLKSFVKASGTDSTIANYDANKPYYYVTEKTTGDIFIFMALETDTSPSAADEFSQEQMAWLSNLLDTYYGTGVNIYLIEHSPIKGFGAGDRMSNPYYKAHLSESYTSTVQFKALLQKYEDIIWMSGHTHEDFTMGYNYSNENNTACNMIHNPAVAGSTWASISATSLDYNNGVGYNSQGYYVETYENEVVYYGANLTDELIYPAYCYIMEGSRGSSPDETNSIESVSTVNPQDTTGATGSTLPAGTATNRYYFANTLKWGTVDCYSWSDSDTSTCKWPGYAAKYYGTSEEGVDLYYCDIPSDHTKIIWNNGNNGYQTADITVDEVNNFYTPSTTVNSKSVTVTASVWDYDPPVDSSETTEPVVTSNDTQPTSDSEATEPSSDSEPAESSSDTSDTTAPTSETKDTEASSSVVVSDYDLGDADLSGEININDVTVIQKYLVEIETFTAEQILLSDTDGDGRISIKDATQIQKLLAEIITELATNTSENAKFAPAQLGADSLTTKLAEVKSLLSSNYTFSSYDQYQALKKLYYQYKDQTNVTGESEVVAEFDALVEELSAIIEHIGAIKVQPVGDTYYFENTNNWSVVNCYAWSGSSKNATWPGVAIEKVGTSNGHDVYGIKFDYAAQYSSIIFNNGSSQTVDIALNTYEYNCFKLNGSKDSSEHYLVDNYQFDSDVEPTTAPITTVPVSDNNLYAMGYYNAGYHDWSDIDTFLTPQSDGTYTLDFVATNSVDISLNIYNNSSKIYNCVAASTSVTYSTGASYDYSLSGSTSRGRSVTIKGLSSGSVIKLVYNPTNNTLKVTFG